MTPNKLISRKDDYKIIKLFKNSDEEAILKALDSDLLLEYTDLQGRTLFHLAAIYGLVGIGIELIQRGAEIEKRDFHDRTVLMYASEVSENFVNLILNAGAKIGVQNTWGRTELMYASYHLHLPIMEKLLNAGSDPNLIDRKGKSALDYVMMRKESVNRKRCAELLKKAMYHTPPENKAEKSNQKEHNKKALLVGCVYLPLLILSFPVFGFVVAMQIVFLIILYHIVIKPARIGLKRGSQIPESKDEYQRIPEAPIHIRINSPLYISNLLSLGSKLLKKIHEGTQRIPPPGFDKRMRTKWIQSLWLGISSSIFLIATPYLIQGNQSVLEGIILGVIFLTAMGLERWNIFGRNKVLQILEDSHAQQISEKLQENLLLNSTKIHTDFGLYLRSFHTTASLKVNNVDLETQIAYAINISLPIVALGSPGEHIGFGRIETSEEDWKEDVLRLMDEAKIILLIPSYRLGTKWEIEQLRDRSYLKKTIFIMPPELQLKGKPLSIEWNLTAQTMSKLGFQVPSHFSKGLFFTLDKFGLFKDHSPFIMDEFFDENFKTEHSFAGENENDFDDALDLALVSAAAEIANDSMDPAHDMGDGGDGGE